MWKWTAALIFNEKSLNVRVEARSKAKTSFVWNLAGL